VEYCEVAAQYPAFTQPAHDPATFLTSFTSQIAHCHVEQEVAQFMDMNFAWVVSTQKPLFAQSPQLLA
jgi:hypothetical protein